MTAVTSPAADLLPALIGIFVGAPVLAREFESGTNRFALTRGVGPVRWAAAKLLLLGAVAAAAGCALGPDGHLVPPAVPPGCHGPALGTTAV
jgi:hypothetical protein